MPSSQVWYLLHCSVLDMEITTRIFRSEFYVMPELPLGSETKWYGQMNRFMWLSYQQLKGPTGQYRSLQPAAAFGLLSAVKLPWMCLSWTQEKSSKSGGWLAWITRIVYLDNCNPPGPELLGMKPNQRRFQSQLRHSGLHRGLCSPFGSLGCPGVPSSCNSYWPGCSKVLLLILRALVPATC